MAKRVLIVTCECGFRRYGSFELTSAEDIDRHLAMCTIGEAATATVVTDEHPDNELVCRLATHGEHFDLCMLPLETAGDFMPGTPSPDLVPFQLCSRTRPLFDATVEAIVALHHDDARFRDYVPDIGFGHAASEKMAATVMERLELPKTRYVATHAAYGNTVSSSIPLAMSLASEDGRLRRGQEVLIVAGASGITVGLGRFRY